MISEENEELFLQTTTFEFYYSSLTWQQCLGWAEKTDSVLSGFINLYKTYTAMFWCFSSPTYCREPEEFTRHILTIMWPCLRHQMMLWTSTRDFKMKTLFCITWVIQTFFYILWFFYHWTKLVLASEFPKLTSTSSEGSKSTSSRFCSKISWTHMSNHNFVETEKSCWSMIIS